MSKIIEILKLNQSSTWRGLISILAGFGVAISPALMEQIVALCVAAIGVVEVVRNEKDEKKRKQIIKGTALIYIERCLFFVF